VEVGVLSTYIPGVLHFGGIQWLTYCAVSASAKFLLQILQSLLIYCCNITEHHS